MLGLSLWEGRLPGRKAIENEDKGSHCSYRPESNFGTSDTVYMHSDGAREARGWPEATRHSHTFRVREVVVRG
mgnify:CR=1 FL=1